MSTEPAPTARETAEKKTTGMKMAKAPYEEWEKVMEFVNELDDLSGDWQASDEKVGKFVRRFMPPMLRVCYGYRVLVDNCCDPNADVLEFKPELIEQKRKADECDIWANRCSAYVSDEQTYGTHKELSDKIADLTTALTRSEEEKKIASDALAMVSEDTGELQEKLKASEEEKNGYRLAFEAEIEGNRTLAMELGGFRDGETFRSMVKRIGIERDEARETLSTLTARLKEAEAHVKRLQVRNLVNGINSICRECGHTTTEDGCAFCIKTALKPSVELFRNRIGDKVAGYCGTLVIDDEAIRAVDMLESFLTASTPAEKKA